MLIAQITDTHIDTGERDWRGGHVFDTADDLARAVLTLNDFEPQPDLVILTGDVVDKRTDEEYACAADVLRHLKAPLVAIPGNHDAREPMIRGLSGVANVPEDEGFLQGVLEAESPGHGPMRLILLDTLADGETGGHLCPKRISWLNTRLNEAPRTPTVIAMHHPPIEVGIPVFDGFGFVGLEDFRELVRHHTQIGLILCGHVHRSITGQLGHAVVKVGAASSYAYPLEMRPGAPFARVTDPPGITFHLRTGPRSWVSHTVPLTGRIFPV